MVRPSIEAVPERLERLARQCRRWRWSGTAAVLALAAAMAAFVARRNEVQSEIRTGSLWIVDEHGRPLIRIGSSLRAKGNGQIEFLGESGTSTMAMGLASARSPFVMLSGRDGRDELVLDAGRERGLGITLRDRERNSGLTIATSPDGIAGLGVMAPGGKPVLDLGMKADGSARLTIPDTEGRELLRLPKP